MAEGGHFEQRRRWAARPCEERETGAARARGSDELSGAADADPCPKARHAGAKGSRAAERETGSIKVRRSGGVRRADAEAGPAPLRGRRDDVPRAAEATNFL